MKKTWIVLLTLVMALTIFCSACGGNDNASSTQAVSPTQLPTATKPPEGAKDADGMLASDDNSAPEHRDRASDLAKMSPDQRKVEEELIGATVEDLYKAIGEPKSATYNTSCLVENGQDGILQYDGFIVSTTIFPNGDERVMGTEFD